jgi:hypothetical protein
MGKDAKARLLRGAFTPYLFLLYSMNGNEKYGLEGLNVQYALAAFLSFLRLA